MTQFSPQSWWQTPWQYQSVKHKDPLLIDGTISYTNSQAGRRTPLPSFCHVDHNAMLCFLLIGSPQYINHWKKSLATWVISSESRLNLVEEWKVFSLISRWLRNSSALIEMEDFFFFCDLQILECRYKFCIVKWRVVKNWTICSLLTKHQLKWYEIPECIVGQDVKNMSSFNDVLQKESSSYGTLYNTGSPSCIIQT